MKLFDVILFVLIFCTFIIGIDQALVLGIAESYWIFMLSLMLLFLYSFRKGQRKIKEQKESKTETRSKKK